MNTQHAARIARGIRKTLKVHQRTGRGAIRLPDDAAAVVADVLDHYAATMTEPTHTDVFERPAVMWRDAAAEVAKVTAMCHADAVHMLEEASDQLAVIPAWRPLEQQGPKYLTFTGREVHRMVRYAMKRVAL